MKSFYKRLQQDHGRYTLPYSVGCLFNMEFRRIAINHLRSKSRKIPSKMPTWLRAYDFFHSLQEIDKIVTEADGGTERIGRVQTMCKIRLGTFYTLDVGRGLHLLSASFRFMVGGVPARHYHDLNMGMGGSLGHQSEDGRSVPGREEGRLPEGYEGRHVPPLGLQQSLARS